MPAGSIPQGGPIPPGGLPPGGPVSQSGPAPVGSVAPGKMPAPPKLSARPYIKRSFKLLSNHKRTVIFSAVLTLIGAIMPFIVSASFGPLVAILGKVGEQGGIGNVWGMTGSLYKAGPPSAGLLGSLLSPLNGIRTWLATPLTFSTIFIIWAVATVGAALLRFVQQWTMSNLEQKMVAEIQSRVYDHLQTLSLDFFTGGKTGALMQRITNESQNVQKLLTQVLMTPILDIFVLIAALFYLFGMSWQMTLVAFALGPVAFWLFRITMNKLQQASGQMMEVNRELNGELNESLSGMADIQIFNAQAKRSSRFAKLAQETAGQTARLFMWMHLSNSNSLIYVALSTALVLLVGIKYGQQFGLGLKELIVFSGFIPAMFAPVQRVITSYSTYKSLVPGIVATYDLLDTKPTVIEKPNATKLRDIHGDISFKDVVFGYSRDETILNGISFDIREGEVVTLVGAIGCGKSTIINLLLRFLEQQSGTITIGGQDISDVTLDSLREQVSKLSQFPFFLKDTVRENIRLGRVDASDQEVEAAAALANAHEVIVKRIKGGYDCVVGEQVPSGGQKRLIAFARCLIRQPEVLLLDEPTENLDAGQIHEMSEMIRRYAKRRDNPRTCIIISHEMNFVAGVSDRIIVIDDGKVAQTGTHDELMQSGGLYKKLYDLKNIDPDLLRARGTGRAGGGPVELDAPPPGFVAA